MLGFKYQIQAGKKQVQNKCNEFEVAGKRKKTDGVGTEHRRGRMLGACRVLFL